MPKTLTLKANTIVKPTMKEIKLYSLFAKNDRNHWERIRQTSFVDPKTAAYVWSSEFEQNPFGLSIRPISVELKGAK